MNKIFLKIIVFVWALLALLNVFMPKADFSESENRFFAKVPNFSVTSLLDGSYTKNMNDYVNDHFMKRDTWISLKSQLDYFSGKRESNDVFICKDALIKNLEAPNKFTVTKNIEAINNFADKYKKPSYLMLVPSASDIQKNKLPTFAEGWNQKDLINKSYSKLNSGIKPINIYDTLYANRDKYIYYKTDHHWTTDGAFLAYEEAVKSMGLPIHKYEDFNVTSVSDSFYGTLYSKAGYRNISPDTIKKYDIEQVEKFTIPDKKQGYDSIYFKDYLDKKDKYSYFLGENQPIVNIKTKSDSNKKLLIFKDSYAHSFTPFLLKDYSEITLVDLRYTTPKHQNSINVNSYDEVLFLYSIDEFSHQSALKKLF